MIVLNLKMASEADSSSLLMSMTQESVSGRARKKTSVVWEYTRMAIKSKDPTYKYCIPCMTEKRVLIFRVKGTPTNL